MKAVVLLIIRNNENETYTHHGSCGGVSRWSSKMAPPLIPNGRCRSNKHRGTSPAEPLGTPDECCISWVIDGSLEKPRIPCVISEYNRINWINDITGVTDWDSAIRDVTNWYNIELSLSGKSSGISESHFAVIALLGHSVGVSQYFNSSTFGIETVLAFENTVAIGFRFVDTNNMLLGWIDLSRSKLFLGFGWIHLI